MSLFADPVFLLAQDISHNKIRPDDCKAIATALEDNHTLWGIHALGNGRCEIDSKGFVTEGSGDGLFAVGTEQLECRINGVKMVVLNTETEDARIKRINNCWICEGWNETLFEWPKEAGKDGSEPVYLHLESDSFLPDLMDSEPDSVAFAQWRMCPPGRVLFFFTTEGVARVSRRYPTVRHIFRSKVRPIHKTPRIDQVCRRDVPLGEREPLGAELR